MNSSKTNELLKNMDSTLTSIGTSQEQATSNLTNMSLKQDIINTSINTIKTDVDTLAKKKIIFNARLTDGTNNYLAKADYSSSPINFYWENDKGTPVYICKYRFIYTETTEPTASQLYHSTAWESKIGAMNSAGNDYIAPYITVNDNKDYLTLLGGNNGAKKQWVSDDGWVYTNDFSEAPIEIGVSRKFGHLIKRNINTSFYDTDPVGIVDGYYYDS